MRIHEYPDAEALAQAACGKILTLAAEAVAARGVFRIVLAGGGTPLRIYRLLGESRSDWKNWQVYFGDERCLPVSDPERNSKAAFDAWLAHSPIPRAQIYPIPAELGAAQAAGNYRETLEPVPAFDLVLLGMGEDGHTASLFPGHIHPPEQTVHAVYAAPKPPPQRVSLSAARLSDTRALLILIGGVSKYAAFQAWQNGADLPIARIQPAAGADVLIDQAALRNLPPVCTCR